ncbi:3968_t:CDS:10 [Diversispora eburnea]|uniref:3968_t:CDS:1 n=1 Tax=Diversispora eburnea TaxID=1213867 RepID=A0A9N8VSK3_9GLOM|nr:3968_t:CDS:10 [Diversispora eburnea]
MTTFNLLPPISVDTGKAFCRLSKTNIKNRKLFEGQWVRLDSEQVSIFCRVWKANIPENMIQADNLILLRKNHSLVPLIYPLQNSIEVTLRVRFKYLNNTENKKRKQFYDLGFVWNDSSESIKYQTIKSILNNIIVYQGCKIFDEKRCLEIEINNLLPTLTLEENSFKTISGLEQAYQALYEVVSYPLIYPDLIKQMNIECPKGVLLYGPSGVGKTFLVNEIAKACNAKMISIHGSDVFGTYIGESEARLRNIFAQSRSLTIKENYPVILFIDELDVLTPHRNDAQSHESRIVAQLLTLMDGIESRGRLVVVAATNRPNSIDPALRRPGRFDREVAIETPTEQEHLLASMTNGYVGADLVSLCREAAMLAVNRKSKSSKLLSFITMKDFMNAMELISPSTQRGFQVKVEKTNWNDIGGLESVKKQLIQAVEWPLKYRDTFTRLGLKPPRGILLYGPPGCSKTTLVKPQLPVQHFYPSMGLSCIHLLSTFQRARSSTPSVIFFDEIDAIVGKRSFDKGNSNGFGGDSVQERVLSMLLNEMDGIEIVNNVLVVGATNRPDMLDDALLRPGRFDKLIYIPPPDLVARKEILKIHTSKIPLSDDVDLNVIAEQTEFYSGADLKNLCRESAMIALREMMNTTKVVS